MVIDGHEKNILQQIGGFTCGRVVRFVHIIILLRGCAIEKIPKFSTGKSFCKVNKQKGRQHYCAGLTETI